MRSTHRPHARAVGFFRFFAEVAELLTEAAVEDRRGLRVRRRRAP